MNSFFGPSAMAGEGGLLLEELKLCAEVERQNIGESSVYGPNSKPPSASYFGNTYLLSMLFSYHLQSVSLPWSLFYICLLCYGHILFFSSALGHRN